MYITAQQWTCRVESAFSRIPIFKNTRIILISSIISNTTDSIYYRTKYQGSTILNDKNLSNYIT